MLTIVIGGRGRAVVRAPGSAAGNTKGRLVEGGMVGIAPGHWSGVLMSDSNDPYIHYYSRFSGEYASRLAETIVEGRGIPFFRVEDAFELAQRLHRHGRIWRHELPDRCGPEGLAVLAILEELASRQDPKGGLTDAGSRINPRPRPAPVALAPAARIYSYLFEHVAEPTVLDRIASDLGVSRATLCRAARASTGTSVQQLHEQIKIEWAATLLTTTAGSVAETARRVGYADPFYFSRVFRKHYRCSPRDYAGGRQRQS